MWQIYFKSYLKRNPAICASITGASLVASAFLSLLCSLAYNLWAYEMDQMRLDSGQSPAFEVTPLVIVFVALLVIMVLSLALIMRSSFEMSMGIRIHQFGILSSIGATPKQIRACLIQEAAALCVVPIGLGCLLGIAICFGVIQAANFFAAGVAGRQDARFQYHIGVLAVTVLSSGVSVLISQHKPARKLSKLTPIEAIRNGSGLRLKKQKNPRLLSFLFGVEGIIAGNALKAQKKALRIANLSLLLSFLGFSMMLCFTTLSSISTRHTYFERYQDCWDMMVTVKDTDITQFDQIYALQSIPGLQEAAVYQKIPGTCLLPEESQSRELLSIGGYGAVSGQEQENGLFSIEVPCVILDDGSFLQYCRSIGTEERLDGAIILNRIWDNTHSNFRYKEYVPFVDASISATTLTDLGIELPILTHTQEVPPLREEYPNYSLVHFLPLSLWERLEKPEIADTDTYIRIFTDGNASLADLNTLQTSVNLLFSTSYEVVTENRIQEQITNDRMVYGMQWIFGFFCVLLALIGIANVFSNTLGFLRNRKREFMQYISIGLTPKQMQKLFCIEAFVLAGKPLFIALPVTVLFTEFAISASYLDPVEFWAEAPVFPILLFATAIVGFVSLAYYIGGRNILRCDLSETLRSDAIM